MTDEHTILSMFMLIRLIKNQLSYGFNFLLEFQRLLECQFNGAGHFPEIFH